MLQNKIKNIANIVIIFTTKQYFLSTNSFRQYTIKNLKYGYKK